MHWKQNRILFSVTGLYPAVVGKLLMRLHYLMTDHTHARGYVFKLYLLSHLPCALQLYSLSMEPSVIMKKAYY